MNCSTNTVYYADGTPIEPCEAEKYALKEPFSTVASGKKLKLESLEVAEEFYALFENWIRPCLAYFNQKRQKQAYPGDADKFFFSPSEEDEGQAFLKQYIEDVEDFWDVSYNDLCAEIDEALSGVEYDVRLRFKCICMFLKSPPEYLFAEGTQWYATIRGHRENDTREISDGDTLQLDFSAFTDTLYPRTLRNYGNKEICFYIKYGEAHSPVRLPPGGFLRAVFADDNGDKLLSVKGNICFGQQDFNKILIQTTNGTADILKTFDGKYYDVDLEHYILQDAATKGRFELVLTDHGLFDETDEPTPIDKLIRLYAGGSITAKQYADGRLESNLDDAPSVALAVVEVPGQGLMIRDQREAWRFTGGKKEAISDAEFVNAMLARFSREGYCEKVGFGKRWAGINLKGEIEWQ